MSDKKYVQVQDLKITKALLKEVGGDSINIDYRPIMIVNDNSGENETVPVHEMQEVLWGVLLSLPDPKLLNLRKLAVKTCIDKIKRNVEVASFLGFTHGTYVSQLKKELKEDPLFIIECPKEIEGGENGGGNVDG